MCVNSAFPRSTTVMRALSRRIRTQVLQQALARRPPTEKTAETGLTWEVWHEGDEHSPVVHVLYLFAGVECKAEVRHYLTELAKRDNFCLKGLQLDILRNEGHDLHRDDVWSWVLQRLQSGEVDLFLVAPPCNTHSRARCQYRQHGGPRPLRDFNFPHGFPWLSNANKEKVLLADDLVQKSFQGCLVV